MGSPKASRAGDGVNGSARAICRWAEVWSQWIDRPVWSWMRWVDGWVVRGAINTVARPLQAQGWSYGWHRLTRFFTRWPKIVAACAWTGGLLFLFGVGSITVTLCLPAAPTLLFTAGRVVYPLTWRGRCRGKYHPQGWATRDELQRGVSADAAKEIAVATRGSMQARVTSPTTGRKSAELFAAMPVSECGTWLGDTAIGTPKPVACYASHEAVVGYVAPPRKGKTARADDNLEKFPGPALNTQTKPESFWRTKAAREAVSGSGKVAMIDPEGLTGEKSTFRWSPVTGCRDPQVAMMMGAALAEAARDPGDDNEWFAAAAATVLQSMLLIADLAGKTMADVYLWAQSAEATDKGAVPLMLEHYDQVPNGWLEAMVGLMNTKAQKARDSIMMMLAGAVGFMADPTVAQICLPADDDAGFDVASFLADRSTVYLIASERKYAKVGPLLAAFTVHFFEGAKTIAAAKGGRLDPTLGLFLDEVANTIVLPLDQWVADAGGRGIHIVWTAQSRSQLRKRWGRDGADTIWNATTVKLIWGGITVEDDLRGLSELCGTRTVTRKDGTEHEVPLMTQKDIRTIPRWHVLLIHDTTPVTLLRLTPVWKQGPGRLRRLWRWLLSQFEHEPAVPEPVAPEPAPMVIDMPPVDVPLTDTQKEVAQLAHIYREVVTAGRDTP